MKCEIAFVTHLDHDVQIEGAQRAMYQDNENVSHNVRYQKTTTIL